MSELIVRGFVKRQLIFQEHFTEDTLTVEIQQNQLQTLSDLGPLWHLEMEFLDEPMEERFLRFGTDKAAMTEPLRIAVKERGE